MTRPTKSKIEAIKPDQQDFDAVEKEYGPLPPNASQAALAERYRLAQAAKVVRQLEQVAFSGKTKNRKSKPQGQARIDDTAAKILADPRIAQLFLGGGIVQLEPAS